MDGLFLDPRLRRFILVCIRKQARLRISSKLLMMHFEQGERLVGCFGWLSCLFSAERGKEAAYASVEWCKRKGEDLVLVDMMVVLFLGMAVAGFAAKRWVDL
ncbi:hypothetical protein E3N88_32159 [Mikania micrantha]|uniref:Uncharacterized protein n=1 Tax=Mikania micrantha TaxID=192012 RepID=A0A5N6M7Q8_9ASTR|nr:hypothetical protein E3N88_32159 [Mikania micrantha]